MNLNSVFASTDKALARPGVWALAIVPLLLAQSAFILTHGAWFDEWQALLIAIQSPNFEALLQNLRYEGHPPLWYLILFGMSRILPRLWVLAGTQLIISLITQGLVLSRGPFSRTERLLIASSFFIFFEFGIVSRSLGLGALLLIALFMTRRRDLAWCIVAALPMVDVQFGCLSIVAICILAKDGRWSATGAVLWGLTSVLAVLSVWPPHDLQTALHPKSPLLATPQFLDNLGALLVPIHMRGEDADWMGGLPHGFGFAAGLTFLFFSIRQLSQNLHVALYLAFLLFCAAFSVLIYPLAIRHLALVALLLILLKGREVTAGGQVDTAFRIWLLILTAANLLALGVVARRGFDNAALVSSFIKTRDLQDRNWISWPDSRGTGVSAILGRGMLTLEKDCEQSFMRWNTRHNIDKGPALYNALDATTRTYGRSYLLTDVDLADAPTGVLKPLASFPKGYVGYAYHLYIVSPSMAETARRPPSCPPARLPM